MRTVRRAAQFRRDLKRFRNDAKLRQEIQTAVRMLAADEPLPMNFADHSLVGNLSDVRECHIKPDLLLLYRKETVNDGDILELIRIGSHAEIF